MDITSSLGTETTGPVPFDEPDRCFGAANRKSALRQMSLGAIAVVVGLVVSIGTYSSASNGGGTYFVLWGPVVFGAASFFKGFGRLIRGN